MHEIMSYSDAEVRAAIERLVSSSVRRPYDSLGARRLDTPFADYQQGVAGRIRDRTRSAYMLESKGEVVVRHRSVTTSRRGPSWARSA